MPHYMRLTKWHSIEEDITILRNEEVFPLTSNLLFLRGFFCRLSILFISRFSSIAFFKFFSGFFKDRHFLIDISIRYARCVSVWPEIKLQCKLRERPKKMKIWLQKKVRLPTCLLWRFRLCSFPPIFPSQLQIHRFYHINFDIFCSVTSSWWKI